MFSERKPRAEEGVALLLPAPARRMLIDAALVHPEVYVAADMDRTRALDQAIARIKHTYPQYFR